MFSDWLSPQEASHHLFLVLKLLDTPIPSGGISLYSAVGSQLLTQFFHRLRPEKYIGSNSTNAAKLLESASALFLLNRIFFLAQKRLLNYYATFRGLNLVE